MNEKLFFQSVPRRAPSKGEKKRRRPFPSKRKLRWPLWERILCRGNVFTNWSTTGLGREGSQESEQVVSRARLPTPLVRKIVSPCRWICDGGRSPSFLGFGPRPKYVQPRGASFFLLPTEIHTPWTQFPWTFLETKRSFFAARQYIQILISRSSKIFASFVRNAYVKEKRRKRKKERYSSIFPYPANLASFHFCHRCGRGVDRSRREKPLPSFVPRPSFFLPRANKNANFETKRNELTKSIKLEYQRARS